MRDNHEPLIAAISLLVLFAFSISFPLWATEISAVKTFTLENGLTVYIKEMKSAPVVSVNIWVGVGARNEKPGEEGFTHLIEQMIFKGTPTYPAARLDKEIKKLGAAQNTFTSSDATCFHITGASEHFKHFMELQADAVMNALFDEEEFQKEREMVLKELRAGKDQPEERLYNMTKETAYTVHPYKHPIVGYESSLASATRDAVYSYYKRWYVASNMLVVIVGNVRVDDALAEVSRTMGVGPLVKAPALNIPAEPIQTTRRVRREYGDIQQAYVNLAWHAPSIDNPENVVCDVMAVIMGGGRSSRLFRSLVEEDHLVTDVSVAYYTTKDPSLYIITAQMPQGSVRKFVEQSLELCKELKTKEVPCEELEKAKQQLISSTVFARETTESQAFTYGQYGILGHLEDADAYLDRIRAVTTQDIKRVADKLFQESSMSLVSYEPQLATESKPEMFTLENGLRLILCENHATPIVAISVCADAGGLREGKKEAGLANLTASMLLKGTEKHSAEELARAFESMGTSISCSASKSFASISMQCLSEKFEPSFELLMEILTLPSFPESEFEIEQKKVFELLRQQDDDLFAFTNRKVLETLFEGHQLGYPNLGISDDVNNLQLADLKKFFEKYYVASGMVVAVVGDIFVRDIKDMLISKLSKITKGELPEIKQANFQKLNEPIVVNSRLNREQAQIMLATRTFSRNDPRTPAMDILKNILLGSTSSRLFINLRDKDALTYSLFAANVGTRVTGYFFVTLSTAVDKVDLARKRLLEEIEKIRTEGFSNEEMNDAKQYIVGKYALGLVTNQAQAETFAEDESFGLGFDYYSKYPDIIRAVKREDIASLMQEFLPCGNFYVIGITTP